MRVLLLPIYRSGHHGKAKSPDRIEFANAGEVGGDGDETRILIPHGSASMRESNGHSHLRIKPYHRRSTIVCYLVVYIGYG